MELWIGKVFKYKNILLIVKKEKVENECTGCFFNTESDKRICCKKVFCKGKDIIFAKIKEEQGDNKS